MSNPHMTLWGEYDYDPIVHMRCGKRPKRRSGGQRRPRPRPSPSEPTHVTAGSVASGCPQLRTWCPKRGLCPSGTGVPRELGRNAAPDPLTPDLRLIVCTRRHCPEWYRNSALPVHLSAESSARRQEENRKWGQEVELKNSADHIRQI